MTRGRQHHIYADSRGSAFRSHVAAPNRKSSEMCAYTDRLVVVYTWIKNARLNWLFGDVAIYLCYVYFTYKSTTLIIITRIAYICVCLLNACDEEDLFADFFMLAYHLPHDGMERSAVALLLKVTWVRCARINVCVCLCVFARTWHKRDERNGRRAGGARESRWVLMADCCVCRWSVYRTVTYLFQMQCWANTQVARTAYSHQRCTTRVDAYMLLLRLLLYALYDGCHWGSVISRPLYAPSSRSSTMVDGQKISWQYTKFRVNVSNIYIWYESM